MAEDAIITISFSRTAAIHIRHVIMMASMSESGIDKQDNAKKQQGHKINEVVAFRKQIVEALGQMRLSAQQLSEAVVALAETEEHRKDERQNAIGAHRHNVFTSLGTTHRAKAAGVPSPHECHPSTVYNDKENEIRFFRNWSYDSFAQVSNLLPSSTPCKKLDVISDTKASKAPCFSDKGEATDHSLLSPNQNCDNSSDCSDSSDSENGLLGRHVADNVIPQAWRRLCVSDGREYPGSRKIAQAPDVPISCLLSCFNCGENGHRVSKCPLPRDTQAIARRRNEYHDNCGAEFGSSTRYFLTFPYCQPPFHASLKLAEALAISSGSPLPFLSKQRLIGYPPAYVDVSEHGRKVPMVSFAGLNTKGPTKLWPEPLEPCPIAYCWGTLYGSCYSDGILPFPSAQKKYSSAPEAIKALRCSSPPSALESSLTNRAGLPNLESRDCLLQSKVPCDIILSDDDMELSD